MNNHKTKHSTSLPQRAMLVVAAVILVLGLVGLIVGAVKTYHGVTESDQAAALNYVTLGLALFTLLLAVGVPVTIWMSKKEREEQSILSLEQEQDGFYAQLDGIYLEIQKLIIEHPHLGNPEALLNRAEPVQVTQYDAFAFIVWNFIESIHDLTGKRGDSPREHGKTEMLIETWQSIIDYEGARHAEWFLRAENRHKFKESFRDYIKHKSWIVEPPASKT